jgi:hypothetical protein
MPNGKPGDHPITDILIHKRMAFSADIDSLIVKIIGLGGEKELERSFNLLAPPALPEFERALKEMHERLLKDAKQRGWEV